MSRSEIKRLPGSAGETEIRAALDTDGCVILEDVVEPVLIDRLLADLTPDEIRVVIDLLFKQRRAATLLAELPAELLPQVFDAVTDQRLADVLARLEVDDMLEVVEEIPEERRDAVRALLRP